MDTDKISLQMYTVREKAAQDLDGTLQKVAEIGYKNVELAGFYGLSASELRAKLDNYGLSAKSAHVQFALFESDPKQAFADMHTLGCEYAIVPFLAPERRQTRAQLEEIAATLNRLGEQANADNLQFGYHNHAFEFAPVEGTSLFETLINRTIPDLVKLELDLYWATAGGADALELQKQYPGRFPLLHMKDMAATEDRVDLPVGQGILPWEEIYKQAQSTNTAYYVVEMDRPRIVFDDITDSFKALRQL
jgi:sugar phosphate isomerase/epimerase